MVWFVPLLLAVPTFYKDIAPITYKECAGCHRPGEAAPFPLISYPDVRKRAGQIAAVTKARYMPPWPPQADFGAFQEERRLTDRQIRTIAEWVAAGAPEGNPADAPPLPKFTGNWLLGEPDLIVKAAQPYIMRADGLDQFWNFILHVPVKSPHYVRAVEIRPGNPRIVHHANLLVDRARSARNRESKPGAGFEGMDLDIESDTFDPDSHFLFWKPGSAPYVEPAGLAWRLEPGNDLVLNVHLQTTGRQETVAPSVGLYFTNEPQTEFPMLIQLEHDGALKIPAGAKDFEVSDDFQLPLDVDVLAVYPHAHYLGKLLEGYATLPDGTRKPLIRIPDWDLNWQAVYRYREPLFLPKGTVISMRFHYDNSDGNPRNPNHPPKLVVSGNQAKDEMGHLWLQVLPRGPEDKREIIQEAVMLHRLDKYPGDFSAHFNLGALMLARKQPDAAIPWLRDAVRIQPDQPAALNALGAALMASGNTAEAKTQFEQVLRLQPGYTNARYNLANLLADEGHVADAVPLFRRVTQEIPDDATAREHLFIALTMLSDSLANAGKLQGAADTLREALAIHPENADLRGAIDELQGRIERARR